MVVVVYIKRSYLNENNQNIFTDMNRSSDRMNILTNDLIRSLYITSICICLVNGSQNQYLISSAKAIKTKYVYKTLLELSLIGLILLLWRSLRFYYGNQMFCVFGY